LSLRRTWAIALAVLGAGLGMLGVGLAVGERGDTAAWAAALTESAPTGDVQVTTTPLGGDRVVICIVDTTRNRLMVYLADGKRSRLRLLAVRDISADWALSDYNNERPYPKDIRQRVEQWEGTAGETTSDAPDKPQP